MSLSSKVSFSDAETPELVFFGTPLSGPSEVSASYSSSSSRSSRSQSAAGESDDEGAESDDSQRTQPLDEYDLLNPQWVEKFAPHLFRPRVPDLRDKQKYVHLNGRIVPRQPWHDVATPVEPSLGEVLSRGTNEVSLSSQESLDNMVRVSNFLDAQKPSTRQAQADNVTAQTTLADQHSDVQSEQQVTNQTLTDMLAEQQVTNHGLSALISRNPEAVRALNSPGQPAYQPFTTPSTGLAQVPATPSPTPQTPGAHPQKPHASSGPGTPSSSGSSQAASAAASGAASPAAPGAASAAASAATSPITPAQPRRIFSQPDSQGSSQSLIDVPNLTEVDLASLPYEVVALSPTQWLKRKPVIEVKVLNEDAVERAENRNLPAYVYWENTATRVSKIHRVLGARVEKKGGITLSLFNSSNTRNRSFVKPKNVRLVDFASNQYRSDIHDYDTLEVAKIQDHPGDLYKRFSATARMTK